MVDALMRGKWAGVIVAVAALVGCIDPGSGDPDEEQPDQGVVADSGPDDGTEPDGGVEQPCTSDADCASGALNVEATCAAGGVCERVCAQGFVVAPGATIDAEGCACAPSEERCDGQDNDCDGEVDEGFEGLGEACSDGQGECAGEGMVVCAPDGMGVICQAEGSSPVEERCDDGKDNDCDGEIDEGFEQLGMPCAVGEGVCERAGTFVCSADGKLQVCDVVAGTPNPDQAAGETYCDGQDNDCDGEVDEGCDDDADDYCDKAMTVVASPDVCPRGGMDCDDTAADVYPGAPGKCDGKDNDCNGQVDEYKISPDTTQHKSVTLSGNATMADASYLNPTVMAAPMTDGFCVGSVVQSGTSAVLHINRIAHDGSIKATCAKTVARRSGDTGSVSYRIYDIKAVSNGCAMVLGWYGPTRPATVSSATVYGGYDLFHYDSSQSCVTGSELVSIAQFSNVYYNNGESSYNKALPSAAIGSYAPISNYRANVGYTWVNDMDEIKFSTRSWSVGSLAGAINHSFAPYSFELAGTGDSAGNSYFLLRATPTTSIIQKVSTAGLLSPLGSGFSTFGASAKLRTFFMDSVFAKAYIFMGGKYDELSFGGEYNPTSGVVSATFALSGGGSYITSTPRYAGRHLVAPPLAGSQHFWVINPGNNYFLGAFGADQKPLSVPGNPANLLAVSTSGDKGHLLAMTSASDLAVKIFPFSCY